MIKDSKGNVIKDRNGTLLDIGDYFIYQQGKPFADIGKFVKKDGVVVIVWFSAKHVHVVDDFWHNETDPPETLKVNVLEKDER